MYSGYPRAQCVETYITICKVDNQREFAVCLRELKQGLCINLEGSDGEADGREVQEGGDKYTPTKTRPGADCGSNHELLIAKFRLKLKKVGKNTMSFM